MTPNSESVILLSFSLSCVISHPSIYTNLPGNFSENDGVSQAGHVGTENDRLDGVKIVNGPGSKGPFEMSREKIIFEQMGQFDEKAPNPEASTERKRESIRNPPSSPISEAKSDGQTEQSGSNSNLEREDQIEQNSFDSSGSKILAQNFINIDRSNLLNPNNFRNRRRGYRYLGKNTNFLNGYPISLNFGANYWEYGPSPFEEEMDLDQVDYGETQETQENQNPNLQNYLIFGQNQNSKLKKQPFFGPLQAPPSAFTSLTNQNQGQNDQNVQYSNKIRNFQNLRPEFLFSSQLAKSSSTSSKSKSTQYTRKQSFPLSGVGTGTGTLIGSIGPSPAAHFFSANRIGNLNIKKGLGNISNRSPFITNQQLFDKTEMFKKNMPNGNAKKGQSMYFPFKNFSKYHSNASSNSNSNDSREESSAHVQQKTTQKAWWEQFTMVQSQMRQIKLEQRRELWERKRKQK